MHLLEVVKSTETFSYKYRCQNRATMSQNGREGGKCVSSIISN